MPARADQLLHSPLLEGVPRGELEQLAALIRTVPLHPGEVLATRGHPGPGLVLVEAGALEVMLDSTPVATLAPGSIFAEDALLADAPSAATLRAAAPSTVGILERAAVEDQIDLMPGVWAALDRGWRARVLASRLYSMEIFRGLPLEARRALAQQFEELDLPKGSVLAEEGKPLSELWVIREGSAELQLPPGNGPGMVPLRAGDYVGELAVVRDEIQPASVVAPYAVRAMRLTRRALETVLDRFPGAAAEVHAAAARRGESLL